MVGKIVSRIKNGETGSYINYRREDLMFIIDIGFPVSIKQFGFDTKRISSALYLTTGKDAWLFPQFPFFVRVGNKQFFFDNDDIEEFSCSKFTELIKKPLYKIIIETTSDD